MFKYYYLKEENPSPTESKEDKNSQIIFLTNLGITPTQVLSHFPSA
jgi:hypothetical protein